MQSWTSFVAQSFVGPLWLPFINETFDSFLTIVQLQIISHCLWTSFVSRVQIHSELLVIKFLAKWNDGSGLAFNCVANSRQFIIKFFTWHYTADKSNLKSFLCCYWKTREQHVTGFHSGDDSRNRNAGSATENTERCTRRRKCALITADCNISGCDEL